MVLAAEAMAVMGKGRRSEGIGHASVVYFGYRKPPRGLIVTKP
jgi:hypothetical protein